jgi:hypothetical protein
MVIVIGKVIQEENMIEGLSFQKMHLVVSKSCRNRASELE